MARVYGPERQATAMMAQLEDTVAFTTDSGASLFFTSDKADFTDGWAPLEPPIQVGGIDVEATHVGTMTISVQTMDGADEATLRIGKMYYTPGLRSTTRLFSVGTARKAGVVTSYGFPPRLTLPDGRRVELHEANEQGTLFELRGSRVTGAGRAAGHEVAMVAVAPQGTRQLWHQRLCHAGRPRWSGSGSRTPASTSHARKRQRRNASVCRA